MTFSELVMKRQSCRVFARKPLEREKLVACLEAARLAPSANNAQPWRFVAVDDPDIKRSMADALSFNRFALDAGALVVVVENQRSLSAKAAGAVKDNKYAPMDIGMAVENFCLAAAEQGLGTCILGWFDEDIFKKRLGIPDSKRVRLVVAVGYPKSDEIRPKNRRPFDEIVSFNKY